jgi:hypothetical protein
MRHDAGRGKSLKRLRRIIFNGLTVVSLLLCIATVVLWVRSYWATDGFAYARNQNISIGRSVRGKLSILTVEGRGHVAGFAWVRWAQLVDMEVVSIAPEAFGCGFNVDDTNIRFAGFHYQRLTQSYAVRQPLRLQDYPSRLLTIPYWLVCLVCAWPIVPTIHRRVNVIRLRNHLCTCRKCGYDLRATPDRCPECGTMPTKVKA